MTTARDLRVRWHVRTASGDQMRMTCATLACGLFGLFTLLAGTGCSKRDKGVDSDEETPRVLRGGGDAGDPAVVAVLTPGGGLCTGTLIASRFVLTAQHCVEDGGRVAVTFGSRSRGTRIPARVHLPPRSFTFGRTSDIAVLELAEASSVRPIPVNLNAQGLDDLDRIRVIGYGVTGTDNHDGGLKRTATVRATVTRSYVESVGSDGTCFGDSGGPALAVIGGREQLVAVTSHGTARRCEDGHGRYVRTDVHRAFLQRFVGNEGATPPNEGSVAERPRPQLQPQPQPQPQQPMLPEAPEPLVQLGVTVGADGSIHITTSEGSTVAGDPGGCGGGRRARGIRSARR